MNFLINEELNSRIANKILLENKTGPSDFSKLILYSVKFILMIVSIVYFLIIGPYVYTSLLTFTLK